MTMASCSHRHQRRWQLAAVLGGLAGLAGVGAVALASAADSPHYHVIRSVDLAGSEGWDYITLDPQTRRLYITRGNHVMVLNADSGAAITDITGLKGVHGVALAGERGYISDGGANTVVVFDRHTARKLTDIPVGNRPDGILYDNFSGRLFTFNGGSGDATAIDVATGQVVGTVALGGKPEAAEADGHGTIFVNIEDKSQVVAFDSKTLKLGRRWSLAPCTEPSGMAIDVAHERIFSGCDNAMMAVSDTRAGKVVTTIPIGAGVDSNRFDATDGLVFSSNGGSGTLTVVRERTPDEYTVLANVPTARSARTMELDPGTHRIYLVAAQFSPEKAAPGQPRHWPVVVPGSVKLLMVDR